MCIITNIVALFHFHVLETEPGETKGESLTGLSYFGDKSCGVYLTRWKLIWWDQLTRTRGNKLAVYMTADWQVLYLNLYNHRATLLDAYIISANQEISSPVTIYTKGNNLINWRKVASLVCVWLPISLFFTYFCWRRFSYLFYFLYIFFFCFFVFVFVIAVVYFSPHKTYKTSRNSRKC